jgi:hypothetical protein
MDARTVSGSRGPSSSGSTSLAKRRRCPIKLGQGFHRWGLDAVSRSAMADLGSPCDG